MIEQQYTVNALAKIFKKHPRTIRRWIEEETFPNVIKIKGEFYVPERDLKKLLGVDDPPAQALHSRRVLSRGISS